MKLFIKKTWIKSGSLVFFFLLSSCATLLNFFEPQDTNIYVKETTKLPDTFKQVPAYDTADVVLPTKFLQVFKIQTDQTEMREGPGTEFNLKDQFLRKNQEVLVLKQLSVWRKVQTLQRLPSLITVDTKLSLQGWVHYKTLASTCSIKKSPPKKSNPNSCPPTLVINNTFLPKVFAIHEVKSLYSFPEKHILTTTIPKGHFFTLLKKEKGKSLVLIPETSSLAWVDFKDFK